MAREPSRAWILTGSPENYAATLERGLRVIGLKERRRNFALEIDRGDQIFLYLTRRMAFAASVRVVGELFEDRSQIWPGKPGRADAYPWRFPTEPEVVLDEPDWLPAETLVDELEHIRKWPREHWKLAFQGQIRPVSAHDCALLADRMGARAGARA